MPTESSKQEALKRLAYIEGHIKGIRKMVEEDQYCVDVLKQSYAVQRAIEKFELTLLRGHLSSCVPTGIREGREEQVIDEIAELFELNQK
jgi:DNA-binding FrmR family transcriptional regulator